MSNFLLSFLFLLAAPAQQTANPSAAELCTLQGVVVKAGTGEPLHKAFVAVAPASNRAALEGSAGGSAETDAMGRFEIKGIVPGRYRLSAERNGYVTQWYGQAAAGEHATTVTLSAGQRGPDITFQMVPAAVITGHVYDEDSEPALHAQVEAMQYAYVSGQRQLMVVGAAETDDLGEFRIFGLSPGQYFVQATFQPHRFENVKTLKGYVPIFYPGITDASHAAPITVRGGDEFPGVDISLQPVHGFTVKGTVVNAGCGETVSGAAVFIREQGPNQSSGWFNTMRTVHEQGSFEISGVVPGSYYVYALISQEGKQCISREAVEVADADIDGVVLNVVPGVEIKGHLRVEGQLGSNPGALSVMLSSKNTASPIGGLSQGSSQPDGGFLLKNVLEGDYEIHVDGLAENSFVKSARLDGVEVLAAGLTVDAKQAPGALEIMVSPNGASIDGAVSQDQQPFPGATVALVPDPPHRGERRLFKSTTTDQNGHFGLQGVPPGDYKVFAWEKIEPGAYTSPEFLQPYESLGESVHITEGSHNSVQVDLIPAKDANQ